MQKHCIRVLFGDLDTYLDKFCTCARTRPYGEQKLGHAFYCKEHTKPLYNETSILAVQNLYTYHCCIEMFKILKFHKPIALYSLLNISNRNNSMLIIPPVPSIQFMYNGSRLWNVANKKLLNGSQYDRSTKLSFVKNSVKQLLLKNQSKFDKNEWYPTNFEL